MTSREIAQRLRDIASSNFCGVWPQLKDLADEIDPPRPEPGTVVVWRFLNWPALSKNWEYGVVGKSFNGVQISDGSVPFENIEWKPARILGPEQVAVDVPPVSGWPVWAEAMAWSFISPVTYRDNPFVTRDEAERLENER